MKKLLTVVIPSWNNAEYLDPCIHSMQRLGFFANSNYELIIINNGEDDVATRFNNIPNLSVISEGVNLGWEGGLALALKYTDSKFVCFQNDDVFLPTTSVRFYENLLWPMHDKSVGIVGPVTTVSAGAQSIYHPASPLSLQNARWLIGFTMMVRREALDNVGGIDTSLPGGDDFDLSIRMRESGYKLLIQPSAFIIHHGFKTGIRVHGDHTIDGGWNSPKMTETTNITLIKKHGFKKFMEIMSGQLIQHELSESFDLEGNIVREHIKQGDMVVEIGCGPKKSVPQAIGIDRIARGQIIPHLQNEVSQADIVSDATDIPVEDGKFDVVVARHILEHIVDTNEAISEWKRILKPGGKLIIAVPDEDIISSIPMNPEHVHAFTQESLSKLMKLNGMTKVMSRSSKNGVSFVGVYENVGVPAMQEVLC